MSQENYAVRIAELENRVAALTETVLLLLEGSTKSGRVIANIPKLAIQLRERDSALLELILKIKPEWHAPEVAGLLHLERTQNEFDAEAADKIAAKFLPLSPPPVPPGSHEKSA